MRVSFRILLDILILIALLLVLTVIFTDGFVVDFHGLRISVQHLHNPFVFFLFFASLRYLIFGAPPFLDSLLDSSRLEPYGIRGILYFILAVVTVKSFVSGVIFFHFKQAITIRDIIFTYSGDLAVGFIMSAALLIAAIIESAAIKKQFLKRSRALIYLFTAIVPCLLAVYYVLCGYIYYEWGSFLEPHHFQAMRMAHVSAEFWYLFLRWPTFFAFGVIVTLYFFATQLQKKISTSPKKITKSITIAASILLPFVILAVIPIWRPHLFSASVASPLFMLYQPVSRNEGGINNTKLLKGIDPKQFIHPPTTGVIPEEFQELRGIAKGYNLVFFVMESVRRRNVNLYGYTRDTMPTLSRLADRALVFQNAYVMQPRSSKSMAALALGIMPDPRLRPLSWESQRIEGKDTFFKRVLDEGRRFYQGTAQPHGGDKLQEFFLAATHHVKQPVVSLETLASDPAMPNDDLGLSKHFLRWVNKTDTPFVGLLWTECAHMPYDTVKKPFGTDSLVDKYDNSLHQVDDALAILVDGLDKVSKLDNTLIVILGDHGEALGEKFDRGHGNYLFEHSMRIPFVIYNPNIFPSRVNVSGRFQLKDVPATLLYLMGLPPKINQSVNIFTKGTRDKLYMSNVYQDFKLGILFDRTKFVYRPRFDMTYIYDLDVDPLEKSNISHQYSKQQLTLLKQEALTWYKFQTQYVERNYPR